MPLNPMPILGALYHLATRNKAVRRAEQKRKWREKATAAWNARLPPVASSHEICQAGSAEPGVANQLSSLFFRRLPLELRRLIYAELLGGKEFLIKVVHENKAYDGDEIGKEKIPFKLTCPVAQKLLAFPMSWKLAYMDSVHYLYTCNTSRFTSVTAYWCLIRLVNSQSFDLIQHLHMQYSYSQAYDIVEEVMLGIPPYNRACWYETWEVISQMKSLKYVWVDIFIRVPYVHRDDEDLFFSPLGNLRDLVKIELHVNWGKHFTVPEDRSWPFIVRRDLSYHEDINGCFKLEDEWTTYRQLKTQEAICDGEQAI